MMNELFDSIEKATETITAESILGTYDCIASNIFLTNASYSSCKTYNGTEGLYITQSGTITFSADGDGTHSYSTGSVNFLGCYYTNTASTYPFVIKDNVMYTAILYAEPGNTSYKRSDMTLDKISDTRLMMNYRDVSSSSYYQNVKCDKQAISPKNPTAFAAATTNLSNVLTWTDNSSDETGFKVYKKTSPIGSWVLIDAGAGLTVNSNVVTYTDTVSPGEYWYRVKANNVNNGDSVGSKVVKTTNSN